MKKATVSLIGTLLVIMLSSNAGAHPSGLRIDLGGNGFGFSIFDNRPLVSPFWYNNYRPAPYFYSRNYPNRPYLGWGGYQGHRHHNHWGQGSGRHHKKHYNNHRRNHKQNSYGHHRGNRHHHGNKGRQWRR